MTRKALQRSKTPLGLECLNCTGSGKDKETSRKLVPPELQVRDRPAHGSVRGSEQKMLRPWVSASPRVVGSKAGLEVEVLWGGAGVSVHFI